MAQLTKAVPTKRTNGVEGQPSPIYVRHMVVTIGQESNREEGVFSGPEVDNMVSYYLNTGWILQYSAHAGLNPKGIQMVYMFVKYPPES